MGQEYIEKSIKRFCDRCEKKNNCQPMCVFAKERKKNEILQERPDNSSSQHE